jgi:hypothetical protein
MQNILTKTDLRTAIIQLEIKQAEERDLLKGQFLLAYDSIKPINIIKGALNDISSSPYLIDNVIGTALGMATGYLSKKVIIGTSANIFRNIIGSILQFGVTNLVAKHPDGIKSIGQYIFNRIFPKNEHTAR